MLYGRSRYDILGPTKHLHVSYNSVFHLLAMKAAAELATVMGDAEFARTCTAALTRGQQALNTQQWVENGTASHYSFSVETPESLMADTLYAQLLADSVGLGSLIDEQKMKSHLETEALWNDSPFGLRVESNAGVSTGSGEAVWQGGSPNWAAINIRHGFLDVETALLQPKKSLGLWRDGLRDFWNICGLSQNGQSWITSHYGFAMTAWHLPYAISGQAANLPNGSLTFDPKLVQSHWVLPYYLPGVLGNIKRTADGVLSLDVKVGALELQHLSISGIEFPGTVSLKAGHNVTWK